MIGKVKYFSEIKIGTEFKLDIKSKYSLIKRSDDYGDFNCSMLRIPREKEIFVIKEK